MSTWLRKKDVDKLGASFFSFLETISDKAFATRFFDLYLLIEESRAHILRIFGSDVKMELTLDEDPESGHLQLSLTIFTRRDVHGASKLLDQFDKEFWLANIKKADGLFGVYLEFI